MPGDSSRVHLQRAATLLEDHLRPRTRRTRPLPWIVRLHGERRRRCHAVEVEGPPKQDLSFQKKCEVDKGELSIKDDQPLELSWMPYG